MFEADQLRKIVDNVGTQMKAMVLLAANCALGNSDIANMPIIAVDLKTGWLDYPRPKTGIARRCPLWKETVEAINLAIDERPAPKDQANAGLLFITKYGRKWANAVIVPADPEKKIKEKNSSSDPITQEFSKILRALGIKQKGLSFYAIRHGFQTIGSKSRDKDAVRAIMGHVDDSMDAAYDEEPIDDARLQAVTNHVRAWLWPAPTVAQTPN
jgi:integrase